MSSKVWVEYTIPLLALMDTETGKVTRVIEERGGCEATGNVYDETRKNRLSNDEADRMIDLMDSVAPTWPKVEQA